jgi:cell division protein ZapA (FtsZ GTPase activity inhibitor)
MRSYTVTIGGHAFQIRSDADPDHVKELVDEVSARFDAIEKKGARAEGEFRALAMVAIVLMDELRDARQRRDEVRDSARAFAEHMITRIDEILAPDSGR